MPCGKPSLPEPPRSRSPARRSSTPNSSAAAAISASAGSPTPRTTFNCIKTLIPHEAVLELYQVHAVTQGTDAQAEVSVRLAENGRSVTAKGADPDTLVASAKAYLGALNKLMSRRQKGEAEPLLAERRVHSTDVG